VDWWGSLQRHVWGHFSHGNADSLAMFGRQHYNYSTVTYWVGWTTNLFKPFLRQKDCSLRLREDKV